MGVRRKRFRVCVHGSMKKEVSVHLHENRSTNNLVLNILSTASIISEGNYDHKGFGKSRSSIVVICQEDFHCDRNVVFVIVFAPNQKCCSLDH